MGYRLQEPTDDRLHMIDTARQSVIHVDNGTISRVAIPCHYGSLAPLTPLEVMVIDHVGWPSPDHPDDSCQPSWQLMNSGIDLESEGYDSVEVAFTDAPTGLTATGEIDLDIVRLTISALCESAISEDEEVEFAVFLEGDNMRDVVTKGTIHIVAGPLGTIS